MQHEGRTIAVLVFELLIERQMTFRAAHPALLRQDDGDRLLLDHGIHAEGDCRRSFGNRGPPRAKCRVRAVFLSQRIQIPLQPGALPRRGTEQFLEPFLLFQQRVLLFAQLHFLQLAQGAQTHVEDRFGLPLCERKLRHQDRARLIFGADDLDHPVKVEEGGNISFDQFQPARDLIESIAATALENFDLRGDPVTQQFLQSHDHRRAGGIEHIEVESEPGF